MEAVSKSEFASTIGVTRGRVSQMLASRQIDGAALVGEGRNARINVAIAKAQLDASLDLSQRLGANGKALLGGGTSADPADASIKAERLRQLRLANSKADAEAAERAGRLVLAADMRTEVGRVAGSMVAGIEGGLPELAGAVALDTGASQRDVLVSLRRAWRALRLRLAGAEAEAAAAEPELVEAGP
jgi:hypothetical protein